MVKNATNRNRLPCFPYEKMSLRARACFDKPRLRTLIGETVELRGLGRYKSER